MNIKKIIILIIGILTIQTIGFAENTATISVSCTIPIVPGFNAPAITTETVRNAEPQITKSSTLNIEEEKLKPTNSANNQILVKTIYPR